MNTSFHFYTQMHLIELLRIKAKNPVEILEGLKKVPTSSIYYHTHRFLQQHHYLSPEPPNDFAYWISEGKHIVDCEDGHGFHFMSCKTFVLPTPYYAHNLKEFIEILNKISVNSLYFHMFEARMRLKRDENDFANWFRNMGEKKLAKDLLRLDPYNVTLEGLREDIINLVRKYAKH